MLSTQLNQFETKWELEVDEIVFTLCAECTKIVCPRRDTYLKF